MSANLLNLPVDLLLEMLGICPVEDVLAMEQTCKYFLTLMSTRDLWLRVVCNLGPERPPDIPPHQALVSLSSADLRAVALRAARLERNWTSPTGPVATRSIVIHPEIDTASKFSRAKLLPGGQFVLLISQRAVLECWRVASQERIWRQETVGNIELKTSDFDFELVEGGFVVMIVIRSSESATYHAYHLLQVIRLDLRTGDSILMVTRQIPIGRTSTITLSICGPIITAFMQTHEIIHDRHNRYVTVMNWESKSSFLLTGEMTGICLTRNHLLCLVSSQDDLTLSATPLLNFSGLWSQSDSYADWPLIALADTRPFSIPLPAVSPEHASISPQISAYTFAWKPTCIFVLLKHMVGRTQQLSLIFFRLCILPLSAEGPERFHVEQQLELDDAGLMPRFDTSLSSAGHAVSASSRRPRHYHAFSPSALSSRAENFGPLELNPLNQVHMEPYSGALTYTAPNAIIINYYD